MLEQKGQYSDSVQKSLEFTIYEQLFVKLDTWWNFPHINSPFNRLYIVSAGRGEVRVRDTRTILVPGYAYILPLHTDLALYCPQRMDKFYIHFRLELYGRDLFAGTGRCLVRNLGMPAVQRIVRMAANNTTRVALRLRAELLSILAEWAAIDQAEFHVSRRIMRKYQGVLSYIQQESRAGLTMEEVSRYSSLGPSSLSRQFKKDTGIPLKKYMEEKLVQKAKEELILTPKRINEIAADLRFSDEFYFSRFFKKMTGVPPRVYRKQNQIR